MINVTLVPPQIPFRESAFRSCLEAVSYTVRGSSGRPAVRQSDRRLANIVWVSSSAVVEPIVSRTSFHVALFQSLRTLYVIPVLSVYHSAISPPPVIL